MPVRTAEPIAAATIERPPSPLPAGGAAAAAPTAPPTLLRELGRALLAAVASAAALSLTFPPFEFWPLAFVALTPWALMVCRAQRPWVAHWISYLVGAAFFLVNLYWLAPVTGLGYVALALYLGVYWPMAGWAMRVGRRHRIPAFWTLPLVWVACELLRAWAMTGFPWLLVGHALFRQTWFIQSADLGGVYLVSFLALLCTGALMEAGLAGWRRGLRQMSVRVHIGLAALLLIANLGYGWWRIRSATLVDGPRVAVIQEDFPLSNTDPGEYPHVMFARHMALAARAAQENPDLIAFPETAWNATQNLEFVSRRNQPSETGIWSFGLECHEATAALARGDYAAANERIGLWEQRFRQLSRSGRSYPTELPRMTPEQGPPATVVVGSVSVEPRPGSAYPTELRFNSALVYDPDGAQRTARYDKIHLVPFGELVPFRYGRLHWLYTWLNGLSPFSRGGTLEYSLTPGDKFTVFQLQVGGRTYRFGTPICYEDVMPYLSRRYVWDGPTRRVDFLVNISNDGWFFHSSENMQHLAICVFRAVENRVGIARTVNTGGSGFIDPNGRLHDVVTTPDGRQTGAGVVGYRVAAVRLDQTRSSLYGRFGDLFAVGCLIAAALLWLDGVADRWGLSAWRKATSWLHRRPA